LRLTNRDPSACFREITETRIRFTLHEKSVVPFDTHLFCGDLLLSKTGFAAEAQLAQRKTELDVREEALIQERKQWRKGKGSSGKGKSPGDSRIIQSQRQAPTRRRPKLNDRKEYNSSLPSLEPWFPIAHR